MAYSHYHDEKYHNETGIILQCQHHMLQQATTITKGQRKEALFLRGPEDNARSEFSFQRCQPILKVQRSSHFADDDMSSKCRARAVLPGPEAGGEGETSL